MALGLLGPALFLSVPLFVLDGNDVPEGNFQIAKIERAGGLR